MVYAAYGLLINVDLYAHTLLYVDVVSFLSSYGKCLALNNAISLTKSPVFFTNYHFITSSIFAKPIRSVIAELRRLVNNH